MKNHSTHFINLIFLGVFSISLALGTWNPFSPSVSDGEVSNSFTQYIILAFVAYLIADHVKNKRKPYVPGANKFLIIFWAIYTFISIIYIETQFGLFESYSPILKFTIEVLLVIFLPDFLIREPKYINYSLFIFGISCSIISVLFFMGVLDSFVELRAGRVFFWGENPNSTSSRIVIAIVSLFYILFQNPFNWSKARFVLLILAVPLLSMVVASGSRGSLIILVVCVLLYLIGSGYKTSTKISIIIATILIVCFFYKFYFQSVSDELTILERLSDMSEGDDAGRGKLKKQALMIFLDNPIFGCGDTGFAEQMRIRFGELRTVHNLYYYVLATTGILGTIPFLMFLYFHIKGALRVRKKQIMPLVILVFVILLFSKTGGVLTFALIWYLISIVTAQVLYYNK